MPIHAANSESISQAAKIIRRGGTVAFPTETVYGLGANGLDALAAAKIFEIKKRPFFDPLILHVANSNDLQEFCEVHPQASVLIQSFWPGPLTVVLKRKATVPDIVCAGLETAAFRMPNHPVALELIQKSNCPIAAPSANLFNYLSPTTAGHVLKSLGDSIDFILDGGACERGIESTIIGWDEKNAVLLRPGAIALEDIESKIGPVQKQNNEKSLLAPGQLPFHYSPRTPLHIWNDHLILSPKVKKGFLSFKGDIPPTSFSFETIHVLSPRGNLYEAASNLFACLHRLDESDLDVIYAEPIPQTGLGIAIMDRLLKASRKSNL